MKTIINSKSIIICISGMLLIGCQATFTDISPNQGGIYPSGGLTVALAGTDANLFAVSLNAGVWRRTLARNGKYIWSQLNGPGYATCIAIDPHNSLHIAVGEKEGDAKESRLNEAGIWESFDNGDHWTYTLNPTSIAVGSAFCTAQAIPSIVFSSNATLIAATVCGIVRKVKGATNFSSAVLPAGTGRITAIAASPSKIWARTLGGMLLVSFDDGQTFVSATSKPVPPGVNLSTSGTGRGIAYSLAASDDQVIMCGCCAIGGPLPINGHNANELIIYNQLTDTWKFESGFNNINNTYSVDGTYLGGRQFVRSFNTPTGTRFFFSDGQAVWEVDLNGGQALVASAGIDDIITSIPGKTHNDFWDFAFDINSNVTWLGTDGGIYENRQTPNEWKSTFDGYHTLHVQSIDIILDPEKTLIGVATQDNQSFYGQPSNWREEGSLGDVNWSEADAGSGDKDIYFYRNIASYVLVTPSVPPIIFYSGIVPRAMLSDPHQPDVPGTFQFIQSIAGENNISLDALLLLHRPVQDNVDFKHPLPVSPPASLTGLELAGNPWLLRNTQWKTEKDFYRALASENWKKELDDLPDGTQRIFVSNGHSDPHYFALINQGGVLSLAERTRLRRSKIPTWNTVYSGIINWTKDCSEYQGYDGPVFVNPYDDGIILLLAPDGVKISHRESSGELKFEPDDVLTALITASGTYPITGQFCSGNRSNVVFGDRMLSTSTLGDVAFFRDDPDRILVSSPYTGVFYKDGNEHWRSFSNVLPQGPVWSIKMDKDNAYIGFAGRSVGQVNSPGEAALATYFTRMTGFVPKSGRKRSIIATLQYSNGNQVSNKNVSITINGPDGKIIFSSTSLTLNNIGQVIVPLALIPSGSVVHLYFTGSEKEGSASSEFHFVY